MKKHLLSLLIACSVPILVTFAATPSLNISGTGNGNDVNVTVANADANSSVAVYFKSTMDGTTHSQVIGTTNSSGGFTGTVSTTGVGINASTPVYAIINGYISNSVTWPYQIADSSTSGGVTFNQNNPSVTVGQSGSLTLTGGNGSYYISSNSNNAAVNASISGNTLNYSGLTNGSSVITVCGTGGGVCSTTTIQANGNSNGGTNNGLTLSPSTLSLSPGQSGVFTVTGGNMPFTVNTISGENLTYYANGNSISISGATTGSRLLNVCSSNNVCSQINVNVSGTPNNALTLTPSVINLAPNQNGQVQISGGSGSYTVSSVSGDALTSSISGNTLTINGQTNGSRTLSICSPNFTCSSLLVSVGGTNQMSNLPYSLMLRVNETVRLMLTGGNGASYYLQSTASAPVLASLNGNALTVVGQSAGSATVTICQSGNSTCLPLMFMVTQSDSSNNGSGGPYTFNTDLWYGQTSSEVVNLQNYLIGENYLNSSATGYFGPLTLDAVKRFQTAKGVTATGYVGPLTRTVMNGN